MNDGILELWLRLLALHVEDPAEPNTVNSQIRDQWLLASRGIFMGCVPDGLEDAVSAPEGRKVVLDAINSLQDTLTRAPQTLDKGVLNVMGFTNGAWTEDFEVSRLQEVGQAFLDLIEGKVHSDATDSSFMPGSGLSSHDAD